MRTKVVAVLLLVLSLGTKVKAQTDTAFWFAMPHVIGGLLDRDTPILFRIMPVDIGANVRIYMPAAKTILDTTVWVDAGGVRSVNLTKFKTVLENMPHGKVLDRGIKIESDQMITAYFDEASTRNPEIYALKGANALGSAFYIPGQTKYLNNQADGGAQKAYNAFDIVATEDNTVITIKITNDIIASDGTSIYKKASDGAFTITLNKGQTFSCRAVNAAKDKHLGGSTVMSNKQIAITMVDDFVNVGGCSDAGGDQLVPVTIFGTEYASVAGYFSENDRACIMALNDYPTTVITIKTKNTSGVVTTTTKTLNAGETYEYEYGSSTNNAVYISSTRPVAVMHMTGIGCELSYAVLPPLGSCIGSKKVGIVRPGNYETYLILVAPKVNAANAIAGGFLFNGNTGVVKSTDFAELPGNASWQYARVPLSLTDYPAGKAALITNTQNVKFHAGIIYGTSGVGASYGYFSSYAIAPTVTPPDDTVFCNGAITGDLKFKSTVNGSYFEWTNDNTAIGLAANGVGNIPSFNAINNTNATIIARISVVPRANDCDGIPRSFTITVHPTPKLFVDAQPAPVCIPATVDITADSLTNRRSTAGMTLRYYTKRTLLEKDTVLNPKRVSVSGWYYIQGRSVAGCLSNIDSVRVIINGVPTIVVHDPAPICPGETADLTNDAIIAGNAAGLTYKIYKDPTSGIQYVDSARAPKGTYYIIATNISGCASNPMAVEVTEKLRAVAADITVRDSATCKGDSVLLTANSTLAGASFIWYRNSTLSDSIGAGPTYNSRAIKADSTFYVAVSGTEKCANVSGTGAIVKVKVKQYATAANIVVRDTAICANGRVQLTANSSLSGTKTYTWYSDAQLQNQIHSGSSYTTPVLTDDSTFYVTVQTASVCANQATKGADVVVKVKAYSLPGAITTKDTAVCIGSAVTLRASASAGSVIKWYSNAALTDSVGVGETLLTGAISQDTYYYLAIEENAATCKNLSGQGAEVKVTKMNYADPATIRVRDTAICEGGTVKLTATTTLSGGILKWYRSGNTTDTIRTGKEYVTGVINGDSTYIITVQNASTCANPAGATVKVSKLAHATTADIAAAGAAVCKGDSVMLTATSSAAGNITWYRNSALTDSVGTGVTFNTKAINADSTFYVTFYNSGLCENKAGSAAVVTVTKKEFATAANITAADATVCKGNTVALAAASTDGLIKWYRDKELLDSVGVGTGYVTDAILADTTRYYLTVAGAALCANKAADAVVVTVVKKEYAVAVDLTVADTSICKGNTVELAAVAKGSVVKWYSDEALTDSIGVGTTYTTAAINANTTYYVTTEGDSLCANKPFTAAKINVTKKEYATAVNITTAGTAVCKGTTATLTATSPDGIITWYSDNALTDSIGTGDTLVTAAISADKTYYVTVEGTDLCENQVGSAAEVLVKNKDYATAADLTITNAKVCKGATAVLTASSSVGDIKWYADSNLQDSIGAGTTFNTGAINVDTLFYVTVSSATLCANEVGNAAVASVTKKEYATASDLQVFDTTACVGTTTEVKAVSSNGTIKWYSDAALTDLLTTGDSYTTPAITKDTFYYATVNGADMCENQAGYAARVNVIKRVYAGPDDLDVPGKSVCRGDVAALTATTITSGTITWYSDEMLTQQVAVGGTYTTGAITGDSTYYVTLSGAGFCANEVGNAAVVKVRKKEYALAGYLNVPGTYACKGTTVDLAATTSMLGVVKWYRDAGLTDSVAIGNNYTTSAIYADSTYYVTVSNDTLCANQAADAALVVVTKNEYATAADITAADAAVCRGSVAALTASSSAGNIQWFSDRFLRNNISSGTSYTTPAVEQDTTYYLTVSSTTLCANKASDAAIVKVKKKEYAVAADIALADTSVCKESVATLVAVSNGDVVKWYSNAGLTDLAGTGTSYTTQPILNDSVYYVTIASTTLCENRAADAAVVHVTKKEYAVAADITAGNAIACVGSVVTLSANTTKGVIKWYRDAALTDSIGVGETYTISSIAADQQFYLTASSETICANKAAEAKIVTATKKEYAEAADLAAADAAVCKGSTVALQASSAAPVIKWYRDYRLTDSIATGGNYTTNIIEADSIYYITASGPALCANKIGHAAMVKVTKKEYAIATDVTAANTTACKGTTATLTASSVAETIKWYRDAALTDSIGTGVNYTTSSILADSIYYVATEGVKLCANKAGEAAVVKVVKKEYATSANVGAGNASACRGTTVELTATSSATTINWYRDALLTDSVGTGNTYTTNTIEGDSLYYIAVSSETLCANLANTGRVVKVTKKEYATAANVRAADAAVCRGSVAELEASSAASNTIKWYANEALTDSIGVGTSYTTAAIEADMQYYVAVSSTTLCENKAGTAAVVKVFKKEYAASSDVSVPGLSICKGSTATLTATATAENIRWYRDAQLTDSIGAGASYTTLPINNDSVYYVSTYGTRLCANRADDGAVVTVVKKEYAVAANVTVADASVCKGSVAYLTATTVADSIQWYRDALLTDRVALGTAYTTNTIEADSVYYLTTSSTTLCANKAGESAIVKVVKKEYAVATDVTAADAFACKGSSIVLTASSAADSIRWYRDAALTDSVGYGRNYTTNAIEADSVYYVSVSSTTLCANKSNTGAIVRVTKKEYAAAADISLRDTVICRGATVDLIANSNISSGNIDWYMDEDLTLRVGSGAAYTSEILTANTTYYVTVNNTEKCANRVGDARPLYVAMRDIPSITSQPRGVGSLCEGRGTAYSVVSAGENVTYQWQLDKNDGSWFVDLPGETTPQISLPSIGLDMDGYRYRCVVRNNCGEVISGIVITSVKAAPKVTGDPEDKLVCETQDAVFAVQAGGYGTLKYLWQVDKKDGRGFVSLAAAGTDSSYTAAAVTETMNGYLFRCVVTGGCAPADTSNMAALTVPVAKIGALADQILCNNTQTAEVNLTSSLAQTTFTWVNTNTKVGLKAGGDGAVIPAFTAVNSGTAADSAKITITPVALGCTGPEKSFTIRVNPTPVISSDAPSDLCSDQPFSYAVKSETDKTAFTWTRAVVTGITNTAANGTGNIAETLVNNSTEPVAVTYSYSLTAAGCINIQPVKVTVKPTPVATITGKDICAEENLTLTGSADLKDVTYQWIDVAGKESTENNIVVNNATVSVGGTYQLTVAKAGCNSVPARYTQKVKPLPVATINAPASVCEGQDIVMKAVSDIGADSYIWSGPSGFVNDQPSFTLKNAGDLYQGTYNLVVVKDGCKSHATGSVVQVNKYPTVTLETSGLACENSTAWMKAYSNLPLSTFVWQGMGVTSIDQQMTIKPVKGDILKYYVTVSRNGCAVKDSVEFVVKRSPVVEMPSIADVCQSVPAFSLNATETTGIAGKGVFSGASVSETGLFNPTVAAGTYVITYSYTSEEGCKDAKTVSFKVYPIPGVDAGTDKTVYEGSSVRLDGYISGNYTKYAWSTPAGLALPSMTSLTPMVTPTENTTYLLAAENSYGCRAVDSVNVSVLKFRVPNSFSPNGDGINDNWNIPGLSKYPNSRVEVYNRWGTKLFVSKGYGKAWDGRYNGSYVPAATYYYLIYLNDGTGKEKPIAGWIEVMR